MQLERYIQQNVAKPVDRSTNMPTPVGNAPQVPGQRPLTPYVQDTSVNHIGDLAAFANKAVQFVGGMIERKQDVKASEYANEDQFAIVDEIAKIHEEGDYENADVRIREMLDSLRESRSEDLNDYGMSQYDTAVSRKAMSYYDELVIQESINVRKADVQSVANDIVDAVKRRDTIGAYSKVAEALQKEYMGISEVGIDPKYEYFDEFVFAYASGDYKGASQFLKNASLSGHVKVGGKAWEIQQQIMKEEARNELSITKEYATFGAEAFDKNEDGSYVHFPEITEVEERQELQQWSEAISDDQNRMRERIENEKIDSKIQSFTIMDNSGELTMEYITSPEVGKFSNDPRYVSAVERWKGILKTRNENSSTKTKDENINAAAEEVDEFSRALYGGYFIDSLTAQTYLDTIMEKIPDEFRQEVYESKKVGNLYKEISNETITSKDMAVYDIIDELEVPEATKKSLTAVARRHIRDSIYQDGELRKDAPSVSELEQSSKIAVMKTYMNMMDNEISEEAMNVFGISKDYTYKQFIEHADNNYDSWLGWNKNRWQNGLGYINNGFIAGANDSQTVKTAQKYYKQVEEIFTTTNDFNDTPRAIAETKISGGNLFMKDSATGDWYTVAMPKGTGSKAGDPKVMDMEEFSRQYFVPFTVGAKDFDETVKDVAQRIGREFPSGMVPGTYIKNPQNPGSGSFDNYLIWTDEGYQTMSQLDKNGQLIERRDSSGKMRIYVQIGSEEYPLRIREE